MQRDEPVAADIAYEVGSLKRRRQPARTFRPQATDDILSREQGMDVRQRSAVEASPNINAQSRQGVRMSYQFPKNPKRLSKPPEHYGNYSSLQAQFAADPDIALLENPNADLGEDDYDWAMSVPGRPGPYPTTWSQVYSPLTLVKGDSQVQWRIACREGGCSKMIDLNGKGQELNASSTPHGLPRKPPVCHDIPWAHLKQALEEIQQAETHGVSGKNRQMKEEFKRYVCWGDKKNLHPGHNGCNAAGAKDTLHTYSGSSKMRASSFVQHCAVNWPDGDIWK